MRRAERDDVADQRVPRAVRLRADRARRSHDQAAHRVPDQRDPAYGGRPPGHEAVEQRREGDTVLGDRQAGVGAEVDRGPRGVGGQPPAIAAPAVPGPALPRLVGLAQAVQEDHDVRGGGRERLRQRVPVKGHVAPVASDRHRDRQPVLLLGEPVADQPVDGGDHGPAGGRVLDAGPDPAAVGGAEPASRGAEPAADPGIDRGRHAIVGDLDRARGAARGAGGHAQDAAGDGAVHVAHGAQHDLVDRVGRQGQRAQQPGPRSTGGGRPGGGCGHGAVVRFIPGVCQRPVSGV